MFSLTRKHRNNHKGKRHYWGDINGDYGFVQSTDKKQLKNLRDSKTKFQHRRHHTLNNINPQIQQVQHEGYILYHDLANSNVNAGPSPQKTQKNKKKQLQITNNIQIHLPAIAKVKNINTETNQEQNGLQNYSNIKFENTTQRKNNIDSVCNDKNKPMRLKTQVQNYQYLLNRKQNKIRYTPTYICSLGNPMPTFKLYPNEFTQQA